MDHGRLGSAGLGILVSCSV